MPTQEISVTSVFLYVEDVARSLEFYQEVMGAEVRQLHPSEPKDGELSLAILRLANITIMLHPQTPYADQFDGMRLGVGIHLQLRVADVDGYYQRCLDQGAIMSVSGEPIDQSWGWREFAIRDPDGYIWSVYQDYTDGQWE